MAIAQSWRRIAAAVVFVVLYAWRPLYLGFYSDDWGQIVMAARHGARFSLDRLDYVDSVIPMARPGFRATIFLLSSALQESAILWQLAAVVLMALCAWELSRLLALIDARFRFPHPATRLSAVVSG